jgi:hypothetical protein
MHDGSVEAESKRLTGTKFTNAKAKARICYKGLYRFRDLGPLDVHLQLARAAFVATEFLSFLATMRLTKALCVTLCD